MPEISRFYGIIIAMYYHDHDPPHFHVRYGNQKARFSIDRIEMMDGNVNPRVRRMVEEWGGMHREELRQNWARAMSRLLLAHIDPLE